MRAQKRGQPKAQVSDINPRKANGQSQRSGPRQKQTATENRRLDIEVGRKVEVKTDCERFEEIGRLMIEKCAIGVEGELSRHEFQRLWAEREAIKNRHGGMPPKPETKPAAKD